MICWISFLDSLVFPGSLFERMESINVAGVLKEVGGMLTKRHVLDPQCKLIISPFFALPHVLHCLLCTRNVMSILLLLQLMVVWARWGMVELY